MMAARKNKGTKDAPWDDKVRGKIQASMLVNSLSDHVLGKGKLSSTQVRAAEILLKKVIPDLKSSEVTLDGEVALAGETRFVMYGSEVAEDAAAWAKKHKP